MSFFIYSDQEKDRTFVFLGRPSPIVLHYKFLQHIFKFRAIYNEIKRGKKSILAVQYTLFASKAKFNVFWNFFEWRVSKGGNWSEEKISKKHWGNRCMVTSKNKINVFGKFFSTPDLLREPSTQNFFKKRWFWPLRQTVHCLAKMDFFPNFPSSWQYAVKKSKRSCIKY